MNYKFTDEEKDIINKILHLGILYTKSPYPEYNLTIDENDNQFCSFGQLKKLMVDTGFMKYVYEDINGGKATRLEFTNTGLILKGLEDIDLFVNTEMIYEYKRRQESERIARENEIRQQEKELRQKTIQKTEVEINKGKKEIKYWWMNISISALALIVATVIPLYIHNTDAKEKTETNEKIKNLELKLQETNNRTLKYMDSLWKVNHKTDTAKTQ